jgi:tetratricopeptide (TPR) repeat protein
MGDGREKHRSGLPDMRQAEGADDVLWCCVNCPANPDAWKRHAPHHKAVKRQRKAVEDGGPGGDAAAAARAEVAERDARYAARSGDAYLELLAEGTQYLSQQDTRRAARAYREAIALRPDVPEAYFNLGAALNNSGHFVEAAQRYLEAKERRPVGSVGWAKATAWAFSMLAREACAEVAKPEWWDDEELKALSARVVRAAPDDVAPHRMRAVVLAGQLVAAWEVGPRSAAELREAATHFDRAAALCPAPAGKADHAGNAAWCRATAGAV